MLLKTDPRLEVAPENEDGEICAIIVYGCVPEFMPHCAFRRAKHYNTAGKKEIKCPYCGKLFRIVDKDEKLELIRYPRKAKIQWHRAIPCQICRNEIGIIYVAA